MNRSSIARRLSTLGRLALSSLLLVAAMSCGSTPGVEPDLPITGTYIATTFSVLQDGGVPFDVLASGGSLTLTIGADNVTSGTMIIPPTSTAGQTYTASMAGTVRRAGNNVTFQQPSDSFVSHIVWNVYPKVLFANPQHIKEGATVTLTLTRQ